MKQTASLSISNPCSENWNSFQPTATGGFCMSCSKNVIDFTKQSDEEIINFFRNKPSHTCGKFRADQLKIYSVITPVTVNPGLTVMKAGFLSLMFILAGGQSSAQITDVKVKTEIVDRLSGRKENLTVSNPDLTIEGVVKSMEDSTVMPGITVYMKGDSNGTVTDVHGYFKFPRKLKEGDVLQFSFVGMRTTEYVVPKTAEQNLQIQISADYQVMMGEVAFDGPSLKSPSLFVKLWSKVKNIF